MTEAQEHRSPFAPIGDALHDLREAEAALHKEQEAAWKRYVERVDQILADDLRADEPATSEVGNGLFDAVRGRLDDLRVQARLGAMEGEDLLDQVRRALGELSSHLPR